jgi:hypothetical protein
MNRQIPGGGPHREGPPPYSPTSPYSQTSPPPIPRLLFDATFRERDDALRALAGLLVEIGTLGAVFEGEGFRRTVRPELARLRVELTGVRSSEDAFALRYAVAAQPGLPIPRPGYTVPSFPGGYLELSTVGKEDSGGLILRDVEGLDLGARFLLAERLAVDLSGL